MILMSGLIAAVALAAVVQDSAKQRLPGALDSVTFDIDSKPVKIRYTRRGPNQYPPPLTGGPVLGGPTLSGLGGVPYGELWREEPITFVTPVAVSVAGLAVPPGTYTMYALPGETEWGILVARSLSVQGDSTMLADIVGSATIARDWPRQPADSFTIMADTGHATIKAVVLTWERTLVRIPIVPAREKKFSDPLHYCVRLGVRVFLAPPAGLCHPVQNQHRDSRKADAPRRRNRVTTPSSGRRSHRAGGASIVPTRRCRLGMLQAS